ncbi:MAG: hypothetical protein AUH41_13650 [Gemmatimonadetes bacterium 13_1_40CM_66_11]|nr:MAG: hypothetical protein AUH41_13650 [Gemmatimonadetes bacterium 13_1_40CM_66_11]
MIKIGALHAHTDFACSVSQRALLSGTRGCLRVTGEQLQLGGSGSECGELEDETFDGAGGWRLFEPDFQWCRDAITVRGRILQQHIDHPRTIGGGTIPTNVSAFQIGTQPHRVHAPADAAGMSERACDQLFERVHEQLALAHRCEEGERGHDRLGRDASRDGLRDAAGGELPQSFPHVTELCRDCRFRNRHEGAQRADTELPEPAMDIDVERKDGDRLGSEKLLLFTSWHNNRFARLGAACRDPSGEFPHSPTQPDGRTV